MTISEGRTNVVSHLLRTRPSVRRKLEIAKLGKRSECGEEGTRQVPQNFYQATKIALS